MFNEIPGCLPLQIQICKENIDWANEDKRIFLKQSLETRLVALYLDNKMYHESLSLISQLLKELKRLDDKMVLVEVQLLESRVCHALRNLPKARVSTVMKKKMEAIGYFMYLLTIGFYFIF
jgi:26S proteasome regulatory subunit N6